MKTFRLLIAITLAICMISCRAKKDSSSSIQSERISSTKSDISFFQEADSIIITVEQYLPYIHQEKPDSTTSAPDKAYNIKPEAVNKSANAVNKSAKAVNTSPFTLHPSLLTSHPSLITAKIYSPKTAATSSCEATESVSDSTATQLKQQTDSDGSVAKLAFTILLMLALWFLLKKLYDIAKKNT